MAVFYFYAKCKFLFFYLLWTWGTQIRCPQNRYTDLKSALLQPLPRNKKDMNNDQWRHSGVFANFERIL